MNAPTGLTVSVTGLEKTYRRWFGLRQHAAVRGVDLSLRPGEVLGLVGPNGGGKSTTIRCILGLLRVSGGRIRVFGGPPGAAAARRRTGYLPEESPFPGVLSGREGLDFYGRLAGLGRRARRLEVERLLERTGLTDAARRRLGTYSKGMLRRFGLAQAMLGRPALLVLDEPTSGLDPIGVRDLQAIVREEQGRGASVLLSSHQLTDLEPICDAVTVLSAGRVLASGPLDELLGSPGPDREPLLRFFFRILGAATGAAVAGSGSGGGEELVPGATAGGPPP